MRGAPTEAGLPPLDSGLRGNDDRVGSSNRSFPIDPVIDFPESCRGNISSAGLGVTLH